MPRKTLKKIQRSEFTSNDKAVIYFRVSTPDQDKEGFSIAAQSKLLKEYGHSSGLKIVEEFVDIDTASKSGRISFNRMIKFLQKDRSVTHILTEKVDRLYRNFKDCASVGELGCTLHLVKDGQVLSESSKSSEKLQHDVKVIFAKNFIDNLKEEVRKGMREKAEHGIWPSYAPLGYANTRLASGKNGIVQDKNRAKLVRRLFEMYATGNFSLKQLAQWAASVRLTFRRSGRPVNKATIQGILHNLIYTGDFEFAGKLYKGMHEQIVSRGLWDQVQSVLKRRYSNRYRVVKHDLPFSGLIRCGHCGCAVIGEIKKEKYIYYHCTGQHGKCPEKYARQELIEAQFCDAIRRVVLPDPFVEWASSVFRVANAEDVGLREESIGRLTADCKCIEKRMEAMYTDKLDGRITATTYDRLATQWKPELDRLELEIERHRASGHKNYLLEGMQLLELVKMLPELFERQQPSEKREMLKFVISNSTWKDGKLTVTFRQPFDLFTTWRLNVQNDPTLEQPKNGRNEEWLLR